MKQLNNKLIQRYIHMSYYLELNLSNFNKYSVVFDTDNNVFIISQNNNMQYIQKCKIDLLGNLYLYSQFNKFENAIIKEFISNIKNNQIYK